MTAATRTRAYRSYLTGVDRDQAQADIAELNADGLSDAAIGHVLDLPRHVVRYLRDQAGIPAIPPPGTRIDPAAADQRRQPVPAGLPGVRTVRRRAARHDRRPPAVHRHVHRWAQKRPTRPRSHAVRSQRRQVLAVAAEGDTGMTTPGPFTARPLDDGVWIVVGRDDDHGDPHTVCRAEPCDTHPGRAEADAQAIAAALNAARRAFFGTEPSGADGELP